MHCNPCPTPCSPGNVPTPTPAPLMDITLRQNWSATLQLITSWPTDHGCRHPNLLTDSQAAIVCCTMQVSYGLVGVVDIGRKYSKLLVCISTLPHHYRICHTATHTCRVADVWRSCPTKVSIPHGESFPALGFDSPLFYSLQSRHRYPTQLQDS